MPKSDANVRTGAGYMQQLARVLMTLKLSVRKVVFETTIKPQNLLLLLLLHRLLRADD